MKKLIIKYILFVSLFLHNIGFSQNLVPNPSFEEYSINWFNPTQAGTPDYFHSCSTVLSVPSCCGGTGYQIPKEGDAFSGIWAFNKYVSNVREYIQTELIDSLKNDKYYFFSMFVNKSNTSSYGSNGLGVYFSTNKIQNVTSDYILDYTPQIYSQEIIYDTLNWIQIFGCLVSNGSYKYLTIGNFFNDLETDTMMYYDGFYKSSFFLIDDISLFQLGEGYAGKDSTILLGDSIFLGQNVENLPSKWSILGGVEIANNVSGVLVSPTATTTYVCEQNFCGEVMYDTIVVKVFDDAGLQSEKQNENGVRIYPNPNHGSFELLNPLADEVFFELYNTLGQLVYSQKTKDKTSKIDLRLERGVYFATFNKQLYSQKIVIQ